MGLPDARMGVGSFEPRQLGDELEVVGLRQLVARGDETDVFRRDGEAKPLEEGLAAFVEMSLGFPLVLIRRFGEPWFSFKLRSANALRATKG